MERDLLKKEGIYFKVIIYPIFMKDSFIIIMMFVTYFDLELHQMDVKLMFLNGDINEMIYMAQLKNFLLGDQKKMVYKLNLI